MEPICDEDIEMLLSLFVRGGYVLNFKAKKDVDCFALGSIGKSICRDKSMGKSLTEYVKNRENTDGIKLLCDLFDYYERECIDEFTEDTENNEIEPNNFRPEYKRLYERCKSIVERIRNNTVELEKRAEELKEEFSSDYISKQIDMMIGEVTENPTDAIGKAKELIESCCKTIIDKKGKNRNPNWRMENLLMEALNCLVLVDKQTTANKSGEKIIWGICTELGTAVSNLRNFFGTGHGKTADFQGLAVRHAKLAVGSAQILVQFLWDTFKEQNDG